MTRKITFFLIILLLALSACTAKPDLVETAELPVEVSTEAPEPTAVPPTPEPTEPPTPEPTEIPPTPEPVEETLVLIDDLGREVELAGPAQAIVTLGPSSLESLFAMGAGSQIVGREEYSQYPEEALSIPSVGSLFGNLPAEAILALEPDLVIAPEIITPEQVQALEDLGLTVYWQANPVDFEGLFDNLRDLAKLSGHEAEAEDLIAALDARVQAVVEVIAPLSDRPTVFYELDATDPENPWTVGKGTFIDALITMAGGVNVASGLEGAYAQISSEEVITQNPDVILLADAPYGVTPEAVAERPGWDVIAAVQTGSVFEFDPFLVSVPGPRLVDGLETMARLLHPEAFE